MKFLNDEIRYMRNDRANNLLGLFGFTFEKPFIFDCGDRVYVKGPGVPFLCSGVSECGDDWTSTGMAFQKLIDLGLVPEVVFESIIPAAY